MSGPGRAARAPARGPGPPAPAAAGRAHNRQMAEPPSALEPEFVLVVVLVGIDDMFDVRVYGEPDLSGSYRVATDGTIDFPLAGRIPVLGLRTGEIQARLRDRLKQGYLKDPQITVLMKEWNSRKISVLGQVQHPGSVACRPRGAGGGAGARAGGGAGGAAGGAGGGR